MKNIITLMIVLSQVALGDILQEENYKKLMMVLKVPNPVAIKRSDAEVLGLKEGVVRIWMCAVTDNKSYLLRISEKNEIQTMLFEFGSEQYKKIDSEKKLQTKFINAIFDKPIDFRKKNGVEGATIQHAFILETLDEGEYRWAFREFSKDADSDYSKLLTLVSRSTSDALDIGWVLKRK